MAIIKGENTISTKVPETILFYGGEFGYGFSNFAAFAVEWRGRLWQTSEHAFQAAAFDDEEIIETIFNARSAHDALMIAIEQQSNMRAGWEDEMISVMKDICRHKLEQHQYLQEKLRESGDAELVEDSPKDAVWGRGSDWQGRNELGKIWMELRDCTSH